MPLISLMGLSGGGGGGAPPFDYFDYFDGTSLTGSVFDATDDSSLFQAIPRSGALRPVSTNPIGVMIDKARFTGRVDDYFANAANMITNGDMSSATGWTVPSGVTITGGAAVFDGTNPTASLSQSSVGLTNNNWVICIVTVANYVSGAARIVVGGGTNSDSLYHINQNGDIEFCYIAKLGTDVFSIDSESGNAFIGDITNVKLIELPSTNNAYTTNASLRPTMGVDGGSRSHLVYDGTAGKGLLCDMTNTVDMVYLTVASVSGNETTYASLAGWNGGGDWNFGQAAAASGSTFRAQLYWPFITAVAGAIDAASDTSLTVWEVEFDDTANLASMFKDDVAIVVDATLGTPTLGTSGNFFVGNNSAANNSPACLIYGAAFYQGTARSSDIRTLMQTNAGL